jgi:hypothetical protein
VHPVRRQHGRAKARRGRCVPGAPELAQ